MTTELGHAPEAKVAQSCVKVGAQSPGTVTTAVLAGLDMVLSASQLQRVWMLCAGPVWA
ncbi:MAG TPA: hypothetical protein PLL53_01245 [Saprospiraceae bacterium]|nr:hypothetical protein [Saprospiraceae bacterium]